MCSPTRINTTKTNRYPDIDESLLIGNVSEIIPNVLYFATFNEEIEEQVVKDKILYLSFHGKYHYEPFYQDFGPWNLSVLYRLCVHIDNKVEIEQRRGRKIVMYCCDKNNGEIDRIRVNCAYILAAYLIIYHGYSGDDAFLAVSESQPPKYIGFRDASLGESTFSLHLHDVLRGVEKALKQSWLDFTSFNCREYEHYEKVENGDFNWIIPDRILSFCGPHNESCVQDGYPFHAPDVYFDYFRKHGISTIVRLNSKIYDARKFTNAGFDHVDLFFIDGSTPSDEIVEKFIRVVDNARGGVAVHCKAGLGRTGTLIACWMMKEYGLTATECMAWLRICRPGSVIGPQQQFLIEKQKMCWSMSKSNGVHLSKANGKLTPVEKRNLKKLMSKVDEINLNNERMSSVRENSRPRPNILPLRRKPNGVDANAKVDNKFDETALDEKGRSQGDRLLAMKAKSQMKDKEQERAALKTSERSTRRYNSATIALPSQAYLNKNREPKTPPRKEEGKTNGYWTRSSAAATLGRNERFIFQNALIYEPSSALFPLMASRRSDATRFSSPTTPIKPMSPSTQSCSVGMASTRYKTRMRDEPSQISKCVLSSSRHDSDDEKPIRILSNVSKTSLKKVQLSRPRPYPPQGVRVELSANGNSYELRPRLTKDGINGKTPGSHLEANTDALLGNKRKKIF